MKNVLASTEHLYNRYEHYNKRYFEGKLPAKEEVTIEWSDRLISAAGNCRKKAKVIRLSTHYFKKFPEELDETLVHEMIHLLVPNHGRDFEKWMSFINNQGELLITKYSRERAADTRWMYVCENCGFKYPRSNKLRKTTTWHCGKCKGSLREEDRTLELECETDENDVEELEVVHVDRPAAKTKKEKDVVVSEGTVTEKRCTRCGDVHPAKSFYKDKSRPEGLMSWCRNCIKENQKNKTRSK